MVPGQYEPGGPPGNGARGVPRRRGVRGHVHREHHGFGHRGAGHVDTRRVLDSRGRPQERGPGGEGGRGPLLPSGERHQGPRHPDTRGVRERGQGCACNGRLHQRRAAPAGDSARGRRGPGDRRLRQAQPHDPVHHRSAAGRPVRHVGHGRVRRRAGGHEGAVGRGSPARRRSDHYRQDGGREPGGVRREAGQARHLPGILRRESPPAAWLS